MFPWMSFGTEIRSIFKVLAMIGALIGATLTAYKFVEHKGEQKAVARQEKIDQTAKKKAVKVRHEAAQKAKKTSEPKDGHRRD